MRRIGTYNGVPMYESPWVEPGKLYFIPKSGITLPGIKQPFYVRFGERKLSRWQRIRAWTRKKR